MSVYTSISASEVQSIIEIYQLAPFIGYTGISAGIENTNYLIKTAQGDFVLTLYEHFNAQEIVPYLDLLRQLAEHASYYPVPLADAQYKYLQIVAGKPAALFKCLPGKSVQQVTPEQHQAVAKALASFHLQSSGLAFRKRNTRDIAWIQDIATQISPHLSAQDSALLEDELGFQLKHQTQHLRQGIIHADLFKDNVLFTGLRLTGMLDFYVACYDCYLLDIAITLNDWCIDQHGQYSHAQQAVFLAAYQQLRELDQQEQKYLPVFLRRACIRFWLSRLEHQLNPKAGEMTQEKDPERFKNLLLQHRHFDSLQ
ncbi:hypothetical protein AU255_04720 [Methyloprofundus sedimenti]|uniref:Homoserine kinase n=1 Tax=Methyloprofundus sedimenti TaxID=1420851 RepID=A0A1V8M6M5_9GAMM|nr:homoserine kinase [Methyloprofundus sedimenti]OQK17199.1 hypothetical protein AU255_04720 [Methyloprofundus sedimenti]